MPLPPTAALALYLLLLPDLVAETGSQAGASPSSSPTARRGAQGSTWLSWGWSQAHSFLQQPRLRQFRVWQDRQRQARQVRQVRQRLPRQVTTRGREQGW